MSIWPMCRIGFARANVQPVCVLGPDHPRARSTKFRSLLFIFNYKIIIWMFIPGRRASSFADRACDLNNSARWSSSPFPGTFPEVTLHPNRIRTTAFRRPHRTLDEKWNHWNTERTWRKGRRETKEVIRLAPATNRRTDHCTRRKCLAARLGRETFPQISPP